MLFDNPISSNALKVRFLLAELGPGYERRTIPLSRPRPAQYLARNPGDGIPALRDGDLVVSESHAILRYLTGREGRDDLYPADIREQAVLDEFLHRFHTGIRAAFFRHEAPPSATHATQAPGRALHRRRLRPRAGVAPEHEDRARPLRLPAPHGAAREADHPALVPRRRPGGLSLNPSISRRG